MLTNVSESEVENYLQQVNHKNIIRILPAMIFLALMAVVGFLGNSIVCLVYIFKFPPSTTKCFIIGMALLDLLNCAIGIPLRTVAYRYRYNTTEALCRMVIGIATLSSMASAAVLLAVAVDRYKMICRPLQKQMSPLTAKIACCTATLLTVVFTIPLVYVVGHHTLSGPSSPVKITVCHVKDEYKDTHFNLIYTGIQLLIFVTALVVLIVLYSLIWCRLQRQNNFRKRLTGPNQRQAGNSESTTENGGSASTIEGSLSSTSGEGNLILLTNMSDRCALTNKNNVDRTDRPNEISTNNKGMFTKTTGCMDKNPVMATKDEKEARRLTLVLFLITVIFILSFLPYLTITILSSLKVFKHVSQPLVQMIFVLENSFCIQSVANPIVYSFLSQAFRREAKRLILNIKAKLLRTY